MRKKLIRALAAFLVIMLVFTLLSRAADSMGIPRISTARAEKKIIAHTVSAAGKVMQNQEYAVSSLANQKVKAIYVNEGQQVEEGDLLYELDGEELDEQILTAKQEIEKQKLQRQDTISQKDATAANKATSQADAANDYNDAVAVGDEAVQNAKNAWDQAEANLANYQNSGNFGSGGADSVETALKATVKEKKSAYNTAVKERESTGAEIETKIQEAFADARTADTENESETGTKAPLDEKETEASIRKRYQNALNNAVTNEETAEEEYQAAETALKEYQDNKAAAAAANSQTTKEQLQQLADEAEAAYEQTIRDAGTQVKNAAKAIQSANAAEGSNSNAQVEAISIEQKERELRKLEALKKHDGKVFTPVKGIITKISITTGDRTPDGTAMLMADISSGIRFTAQVPADQSKYISRKDEVSLKPDDNGKQIDGLIIDSIRINSEDSSLLDVTVNLPEGELEIGTGATMEVQKKSAPYSSCVQLSALYKDNNQYYVLVVQEAETILGIELTVQRVDVTVLDKNAQYAALSDGVITADQDLVVSSDKVLEAGDRVRLNES